MGKANFRGKSQQNKIINQNQMIPFHIPITSRHPSPNNIHKSDKS
jgi:hypothetical protein